MASRPNPSLVNVRLRKIVRHAYRRSPFYRQRLIEAGVDLEKIRTIEDLRSVGPFEKGDLLNAEAAGIWRTGGSREKLAWTSTSGTSGRRLALAATPSEICTLGGLMWAGFWHLGIRHHDRILMVGSILLRRAPPPFRGRWIAPSMPPEERLRLFQVFRPTAVIGQMEGIAMLARDAARESRVFRTRLVIPFGQTLDPDRESLLQRGLGGTVRDAYGSVETVWIGLRCPALHGYHMPSHRLIVEIVDPQTLKPCPRGVPGEIVVTSLNRLTHPILRYRIGDRAAWTDESCPCGSPLPRLLRFEGRSLDLLASTAGEPVPSTWLGVWKAHGDDVIEDFQITQNSYKEILFQWIPGRAYNEGTMQWIRSLFRKHLGNIELREERMAAVPLSPSGKRRRVIRTIPLQDE